MNSLTKCWINSWTGIVNLRSSFTITVQNQHQQPIQTVIRHFHSDSTNHTMQIRRIAVKPAPCRHTGENDNHCFNHCFVADNHRQPFKSELLRIRHAI